MTKPPLSSSSHQWPLKEVTFLSHSTLIRCAFGNVSKIMLDVDVTWCDWDLQPAGIPGAEKKNLHFYFCKKYSNSLCGNYLFFSSVGKHLTYSTLRKLSVLSERKPPRSAEDTRLRDQKTKQVFTPNGIWLIDLISDQNISFESFRCVWGSATQLMR